MTTKIVSVSATQSKMQVNDQDSFTFDSAGNMDMASQNGGPLAGMRNRLINGDFRIDQRLGFLPTTIAAGQAVFVGDRWIVNNQTNQSVTAQVLDVNVDGSSDNDRRLRIAAVVAPTTGSVYVSQSVERVTTLANRTATFSFYISCATAATAQAYLVQWFGSGGSANVPTTVVGITLPAAFTRKSASFAIPSTVGKTIGANNYLQAIVSLPIRDLNAVSFAYAQLEEGPIATPFEQRPTGVELALCQRYYWRNTSTATNQPVYVASFYTASAVYGVIPHPVTMRAVPTLNLNTGACFSYFANGGTYNSNSFSGSVSSPYATEIAMSTSTAGTAGWGTWGRFTTIGNWLELTAEL